MLASGERAASPALVSPRCMAASPSKRVVPADIRQRTLAEVNADHKNGICTVRVAQQPCGKPLDGRSYNTKRHNSQYHQIQIIEPELGALTRFFEYFVR